MAAIAAERIVRIFELARFSALHCGSARDTRERWGRERAIRAMPQKRI
jgi:hypothetical protein